MNVEQPKPHLRTTFGDGEPVVQSHPLLPDAQVPQFGNTECWSLNSVVRRPARLYPAAWILVFSHELALAPWNLLARELSMIMLNPRHPAVVAAGLSLKPKPAHPSTVIKGLSHLRRLARWAKDEGLPPHLNAWQDGDLRRFIQTLREELSTSSITQYIGTLKSLHQHGPALTAGGLSCDPWPGRSARKVAQVPSPSTMSTPAIAPDLWFPLIRAAWAYVHTFAPDILRAHHHHQELLADATTTSADLDARLGDWLRDPGHHIPVHATAHHRKLDSDDQVNWSLLTLMLGWRSPLQAFDRRKAAGRRRMAQVHNAVASGHSTIAGVISGLTQVRYPDGASGPWHPGLSPRAIRYERLILRNACFVLVVGLSMMRDSEIHEIGRGSLVEHYGTPAIVSTKHKHDPNQLSKHWWITEPVAEAIAVAEQLSPEPDRIFTPLWRPDADVARSHQMLAAFIAHINATRTMTGLDEIPAGPVRPHMFRRTMAMLTDQFAGSEIALGIQLKHIATRALANRSTQGYAAADTAWAEHLDSAIEAARFRRLEDLYRTHKAGHRIGYGPAADKIMQAFDHIHSTVKARSGDAAVERALLLKTRISLRFGSLNHCAFDESNPAGAVCLEKTTIPAGHKGPLQDRCRPDRCANSIIGPEHLPIWGNEERALLTLIDTPGLPPCRKAALQRELTEVQAVLLKADKGNDDHRP